MLSVALGQLHRLVPFLLPFPRLRPKALRALLRAWAAPEAGGQGCSLVSYAAVRQLATEGGMFDEVLEGTFSEPSRSRLGAVSEPLYRRSRGSTSRTLAAPRR